MTARPTAAEPRQPNGTLRKVIAASLTALVGLSIGSLWYQLGGYAKADDLQKTNEKVADLEKSVGDINVKIGSIDTALQILLDDYKKAKDARNHRRSRLEGK